MDMLIVSNKKKNSEETSPKDILESKKLSSIEKKKSIRKGMDHL